MGRIACWKNFAGSSAASEVSAVTRVGHGPSCVLRYSLRDTATGFLALPIYFSWRTYASARYLVLATSIQRRSGARWSRHGRVSRPQPTLRTLVIAWPLRASGNNSSTSACEWRFLAARRSQERTRKKKSACSAQNDKFGKRARCVVVPLTITSGQRWCRRRFCLRRRPGRGASRGSGCRARLRRSSHPRR